MAQNKTFFSKTPVEEYENDIYAYMENVKPCAICGKTTHYRSKLSTDYICSHECSRTLWYGIFVELHTDKRRKR
jgi:hypothetical protein